MTSRFPLAGAQAHAVAVKSCSRRNQSEPSAHPVFANTSLYGDALRASLVLNTDQERAECCCIHPLEPDCRARQVPDGKVITNRLFCAAMVCGKKREP